MGLAKNMTKLSLLTFAAALQKSDAASAGQIENFLECARQMPSTQNPLKQYQKVFQRDCANYAFEGSPPPRASDYATRNQRSTYDFSKVKFFANSVENQCKPIK